MIENLGAPVAREAPSSRWLRFADVTPDGAKTQRIEVWSIHGAILGTIRWFGRWRQYAFFPADGTIFNPECLRDICAEINRLMAARRTA